MLKSKLAPCRGQAIVHSSASHMPWQSGPSSWVQRSSIACSFPSQLKTPIRNGGCSTSFIVPGGSSSSAATLISAKIEALPLVGKRGPLRAVERHLDDPDLYNKDRKKFDQASDALTKAQKELQEAEDKWLELEVLREEIEQA